MLTSFNPRKIQFVVLNRNLLLRCIFCLKLCFWWYLHKFTGVIGKKKKIFYKISFSKDNSAFWWWFTFMITFTMIAENLKQCVFSSIHLISEGVGFFLNEIWTEIAITLFWDIFFVTLRQDLFIFVGNSDKICFKTCISKLLPKPYTLDI